MATRDLARTAIEGGKASYSKWERRRSNQVFRRETRQRLSFAWRHDDVDEGCELLPTRKIIEQDNADKLAPAQRWLLTYGTGMTRDELVGLIRRTFNVDTLVGWHLVFDHLLDSVQSSAWTYRHCGNHRPSVWLLGKEHPFINGRLVNVMSRLV